METPGDPYSSLSLHSGTLRDYANPWYCKKVGQCFGAPGARRHHHVFSLTESAITEQKIDERRYRRNIRIKGVWELDNKNRWRRRGAFADGDRSHLFFKKHYLAAAGERALRGGGW